MSDKKTVHKILTYLIATVWIVNGLFCKVLNLVPRHQQIVGRILGNEYSELLTKTIGIAEIFIAAAILTSIKTRLNVITQIIVIGTMNILEFILEFILVPDLLLWGKANSVFAVMFILIIWYDEFVLNKKLAQQT